MFFFFFFFFFFFKINLSEKGKKELFEGMKGFSFLSFMFCILIKKINNKKNNMYFFFIFSFLFLKFITYIIYKN